jgi:hypothetical protein
LTPEVVATVDWLPRLYRSSTKARILRLAPPDQRRPKNHRGAIPRNKTRTEEGVDDEAFDYVIDCSTVPDSGFDHR